MFYRLTSRSFQGIGRHSARGRELVSTSQFFLNGDTVKENYHISNPFGAAPHARFFSSQGHHETPMLSTTGFPQYNIYGGESHFLGLKLIAPTFRSLKDGAIVPLHNGKLILEFIPRDPKAVHWTEKVSIGLSAEEVGLICSELPRNIVEISRPSKNQQQGNNKEASTTVNNYSKILTMSPGENSSVTLKLVVLNQSNDEVQHTPTHRYFEVRAQGGEFHVLLSLMSQSIPVITGWSPLMNIAIDRAVNRAIKGEEPPRRNQPPSSSFF